MKNIILNNIGLKLLALFLAIITWFYIVAELQKGTVEEREALRRILPYRVISKQMPIKLDLIGRPAEGYIVLEKEITINPSLCVIIGPRSLLKKISLINTQPIDVSGHTKTLTKDVSIVPPIKDIAIKEKFVNVTIPIVKAED